MCWTCHFKWHVFFKKKSFFLIFSLVGPFLTLVSYMIVKEDTHSPPSTSTRVCKNCGEDKVLDKKNFYFKKDRGDFDKTCTACRKKSRTNRYQIKPNNDEFSVPQKVPEKAVSTSSRIDTNLNGLNELIEFFEILREWRDEFKDTKLNEFNEKWEVSNV
jgi:hypothetical protein